MKIETMGTEHSRDRHIYARGLGDILSETFRIYRRHLLKFFALVAIIQVPLSVVILVFPTNIEPVAIAINFVNMTLAMLIYGAGISAVCQHYTAGEISVRRSYSRVAWRSVSLLVLGAILSLMVTAGLYLVEAAGDIPILLPLLLALVIGVLAYTVYLILGLPAVIVEGHRYMAALRRGLALSRGSELRIIGHLAVYFLVFFGLVLIIQMPFLIVAMITNPELVAESAEVTAIANDPSILVGSALANVIAPPVIFISTTLLYYDLRVKKEGYSVAQLSAETSVAADGETVHPPKDSLEFLIPESEQRTYNLRTTEEIAQTRRRGKLDGQI